MSKITLSAKETAEMLGVSYWLVLELAKKNEIPHIKVGSRILFREKTIMEWIKKYENKSLKV